MNVDQLKMRPFILVLEATVENNKNKILFYLSDSMPQKKELTLF
jgi:hypothetical protein